MGENFVKRMGEKDGWKDMGGNFVKSMGENFVKSMDKRRWEKKYEWNFVWKLCKRYRWKKMGEK